MNTEYKNYNNNHGIKIHIKLRYKATLPYKLER